MPPGRTVCSRKLGRTAGPGTGFVLQNSCCADSMTVTTKSGQGSRHCRRRMGGAAREDDRRQDRHSAVPSITGLASHGRRETSAQIDAANQQRPFLCALALPYSATPTATGMSPAPCSALVGARPLLQALWPANKSSQRQGMQDKTELSIQTNIQRLLPPAVLSRRRQGCPHRADTCRPPRPAAHVIRPAPPPPPLPPGSAGSGRAPAPTRAPPPWAPPRNS